MLATPARLGMRGAALAQALTLSCSAIARLLLVRRFLGIWPFDRGWARLLLPTVLGALTMGLAHAAMPADRWLVDLVVSAGLGVGVYAAAMVVVGLLPSERVALGRLVRRARPGSA